MTEPKAHDGAATLTVGLIIIGDEVLTGKVSDSNTPFCIRFFRAKGIELSEIAVIPDTLEAISNTVERFSNAYDWVVTSGGVGPTHDDLTMDGVAKAFEAEVIESEDLIQLLTLRGKGLNPSIRRLARVPEGFSFYWGEGRAWPVVGKENVAILPGVPKFFESCLRAVFHEIDGSPVTQGNLYLSWSEPDLVMPLHQVNDAYPQVSIGSYPKFSQEDHKVMVTFEGRDGGQVAAAMEALLSLLDPTALVRTDPPKRTDGPPSS